MEQRIGLLVNFKRPEGVVDTFNVLANHQSITHWLKDNIPSNSNAIDELKQLLSAHDIVNVELEDNDIFVTVNCGFFDVTALMTIINKWIVDNRGDVHYISSEYYQ